MTAQIETTTDNVLGRLTMRRYELRAKLNRPHMLATEPCTEDGVQEAAKRLSDLQDEKAKHEAIVDALTHRYEAFGYVPVHTCSECGHDLMIEISAQKREVAERLEARTADLIRLEAEVGEASKALNVKLVAFRKWQLCSELEEVEAEISKLKREGVIHVVD